MFWMAQRGRPFPEVAAAVEEALNAYKERERKIKELKVRCCFLCSLHCAYFTALRRG